MVVDLGLRLYGPQLTIGTAPVAYLPPASSSTPVEVLGSKVQNTDTSYAWEVNITDWTLPDANGDRYSEWLAQRNYDTYFSGTTNGFDVWYCDNIFSGTRITSADWALDNVNLSKNDTTLISKWRNAQVRYWDKIRELKPSALIMGNSTLAAISTPEYTGKLNGVFLEGTIGLYWSIDTQEGWLAVMNEVGNAKQHLAEPKIVVMNAWGDENDYKAFRFAYTSCLLHNAYFSYATNQTRYGTKKVFDEYGIFLGNPIDEPIIPTSLGVYTRHFENGIVIVNSGASSANVTIPTGYTRFLGQQDPTVNNGETGSITIPSRDGIVLQKIASIKVQIGNHTSDVVSNKLIGTQLYASRFNESVKDLPNSVVSVSGGGTVSLNQTMIDKGKEIKLNCLRWPGPGDNEYYHWRDGVGPQASRPNQIDEYGRTYKAYLGTLEAAEYAEEIGAQLIITVNYKNGTAQEAANWVEFCNGFAPSNPGSWTTTSYAGDAVAPQGYFAWLRTQFGRSTPIGVQYWEIGNEIYYTTDSNYITNAIAFSNAMKSKDNTIQIGITGDPLTYEREANLTTPLSQFQHSELDMIVLHYYGVPTETPGHTVFNQNDVASRTFNSTKSDSNATFTVTAKGTQQTSGPLAWPNMRISVNGGAYINTTVNSTTSGTYTFNAPVLNGVNTISMSYSNAGYYGQLDVYGVTVTYSDASTTEVWNTKESEYGILYGNAYLIDRQLAKLRTVYPDKKLALTEVNTGYGLIPFDVNYTYESGKLKSALWVAKVLNAAIRNNVTILNQLTYQATWDIGYALVMQDTTLTPTARVLSMYSGHSGNYLMPVTVSNSPTFHAPLSKTTGLNLDVAAVPYIDAVATYNSNTNTATVSIVNTHATDTLAVDLDFSSIGSAFPKSGLIVTASSLEATNIGTGVKENIVVKRLMPKRLGNAHRIVVPAHSVVTVTANLVLI